MKAKRISLLSGAEKNAGDYLIVRRSCELMESVFPNSDVRIYQRNKSLVPFVEDINESDCVVFAGGPGYSSNVFPDVMPLVACLDEIKPAFFALGLGGYLKSPGDSVEFSGKTRQLLTRFNREGLAMGCRDLISVKMLKESGYSNAVFTGCPAWYDKDCVTISSLKTVPEFRDIREIAVSDPATLSNLSVMITLIDELRTRFPKVRIRGFFHRGWDACAYTKPQSAERYQRLKIELEHKGVECIDISGSADGFSIYDECDLHVGFRVHAHLYNLSKRKLSFLLEEDSRGYGANDALGYTSHFLLPNKAGIMRYVTHGFLRIFNGREPRNTQGEIMAKKMVDFICSEINKGCPQENRACKTIAETYPAMINHITSLRDRLE